MARATAGPGQAGPGHPGPVPGQHYLGVFLCVLTFDKHTVTELKGAIAKKPGWQLARPGWPGPLGATCPMRMPAHRRPPQGSSNLLQAPLGRKTLRRSLLLLGVIFGRLDC